MSMWARRITAERAILRLAANEDEAVPDVEVDIKMKSRCAYREQLDDVIVARNRR